MSRSSTRPENAVKEALSEAVDTLYKPTPLERRAKSAYSVKLRENPLLDNSNLTPRKLADLTGIAGIVHSWNKPGFLDWFHNQGEYRERLHYLFDLALDAAESVLLNEDPKAQSARVNMIRVVAELANKFPKQNDDAYNATASLSKLGKAELEMYLERQGVRLTLDSSPSARVDSQPSQSSQPEELSPPWEDDK